MNAPGAHYELESRVIGSILVRGDALYELPAGLGATAFQHPPYRRAFEALDRLGKAKRLPQGEVDPVFLLAEAGLPDAARADLLLAVSHAQTFDRAPIADCARVLLDRLRRESLSTLLRKASEALQGDMPTEDVTGKLVARLLDLDKGEKPETVSFREAALNSLDLIEAQKKGGQVLRTGIPDLDSILKVRKGNLVVLAARAGIGKTTLALNIADNVALQGKPVLVHSLEMADAELVTLALSRAAEVDSQEFFEEGGWPEATWVRIASEVERRVANGDGFLHINDGHHSLGAICRITEKMHRKHGLALVVVDYLQLVQVDLGKNANREQQVATIARTLKLLAMRLGVPVLALSQLNRDPEKRAAQTLQPKCRICAGTKSKHRPEDGHVWEPPPVPPPKLHDLRESGAIEQDANAVLLLHNPEAEHPDPLRRNVGPFELIVAKQRLGKKGKVRLCADLKHARFRPFSRSDAPAHWSEKEGS